MEQGFDKETSSSNQAEFPSGKLAVLPFRKGEFNEDFITKNLSPLLCPINQVCVDLSEGDVSTIFMEKLDRHLHRILKKKVGDNLFSMDETAAKYQALPVDGAQDTTLFMALALAMEMKADYILIPLLWEYSERIGNKLAAEKPASVFFGFYLISAKQGKRVWKDNFNKSQQFLTDDLLKMKETIQFGGKWATAEELAQAGMQKVLAKFPL